MYLLAPKVATSATAERAREKSMRQAAKGFPVSCLIPLDSPNLTSNSGRSSVPPTLLQEVILGLFSIFHLHFLQSFQANPIVFRVLLNPCRIYFHKMTGWEDRPGTSETIKHFVAGSDTALEEVCVEGHRLCCPMAVVGVGS